MGPVRDDEGPSEADLAMFSGETVYCPKCRAEMFDEAEVCLSCGHILVEDDRRLVPPWAVGVAVVLLAAFAVWFIF